MRYLRLLLPLALCVAALCATAGGPASSGTILEEADRRSPFALVLPELGPQAFTAPEVALPHANLSKVRLRVFKPFADSIRYGKIFTKINGESANTIFNFNSGADGYIINGDLQSKPRFRLQPGKNVVEIQAKADDGREYYASYVLLAADSASAQAGGAASDATTESVPAAGGGGGDRVPPIVHLTQPAGPVRLKADAGTVRVSAVVSDDSGAIGSVTVNGQAVKLSPFAATRGLKLATAGGGREEQVAGATASAGPAVLKDAQEFEQTVTLAAGTPALVVEARDRAGNLTRVTVPIRRREPVVSQEFKGRKLALVVGVSKYRYHDGNLTDLAFADADARAMRDFLQQPAGGGFNPADIVFLENEAATVEAVRGALNTFLPKAGAEDLIFIFVAGHGGPDPYAPQNLYFMLHDTKVADMSRTALPMSELQEALDHRVRAGRVVVFVDTCHSAGLSGEKLITTRGVENNLINLYAARLFTETGRAVLTSSDVNEVSGEGRRWGGGHGVFTWVLLEGLRGGADADEDRLVTAGELFGYVRNRVRVETGFRQNPRVLPGANSGLALAAVAGK